MTIVFGKVFLESDHGHDTQMTDNGYLYVPGTPRGERFRRLGSAFRKCGAAEVALFEYLEWSDPRLDRLHLDVERFRCDERTIKRATTYECVPDMDRRPLYKAVGGLLALLSSRIDEMGEYLDSIVFYRRGASEFVGAFIIHERMTVLHPNASEYRRILRRARFHYSEVAPKWY